LLSLSSVACCAALNHLSTLRPFDIPLFQRLPEDIPAEDLANQCVESRLKRLAKEVFGIVPALTIVSLGQRGVKAQHSNSQACWEQCTYVRADVKDIGSQMSVEAIKTDHRDARELEPRAEILYVDASDPDVLFQRYGHG
jgi:hypothetical protein